MENTMYFAYGSNINLEQMAYRCPDASVVGPVTLEGWELLFRRGGFATIAPKEGEQVTGLLWSITQSCERSLDRYEGYPRFYNKQMVTVRDSNSGCENRARLFTGKHYELPNSSVCCACPFYCEEKGNPNREKDK